MASRNIKDLHETLQDAFTYAKEQFEAENPNHIAFLTATYRSPEEQFELFKQGRKEVTGEWVLVEPKLWKTDKDGYKKKSKHNVKPALAFDIALKFRQNLAKLDWSPELFKEFDEWVQKFASDNGVEIEWGGTWRRKDRPHWQLNN
jgi:hypothetical protein